MSTMPIYHVRYFAAGMERHEEFTDSEDARDYAGFAVVRGVHPVEQWTTYIELKPRTPVADDGIELGF